MGKYIKTAMDNKITDYLAIELYKKDPSNPVLLKFMDMKNEEGYHLTKVIKEYNKTTWRSPTGRITYKQFLNNA